MHHGLLDSSDAFMILEEETNFVEYFVNNGYVVFTPNSRGNS